MVGGVVRWWWWTRGKPAVVMHRTGSAASNGFRAHVRAGSGLASWEVMGTLHKVVSVLSGMA